MHPVLGLTSYFILPLSIETNSSGHSGWSYIEIDLFSELSSGSLLNDMALHVVHCTSQYLSSVLIYALLLFL